MPEPIALDVYIEETRVGVLTSNLEGLYVFTYLPETPPEKLVSLTMPVRAESYKWGRGLRARGLITSVKQRWAQRANVLTAGTPSIQIRKTRLVRASPCIRPIR